MGIENWKFVFSHLHQTSRPQGVNIPCVTPAQKISKMAVKGKLSVKESNFPCALCTLKYKSQKFLDNHMVSKHNPNGIVLIKEKKKKLLQKKVEEIEVIEQIVEETVTNEMDNILTEVVDTVTSDKVSEVANLASEMEGDKEEAPKEVEKEALAAPENAAAKGDDAQVIDQTDQTEVETLSQIAKNMAVIEQMIDGDDMFGSCDECEYVSINDADLKGHKKQHQVEGDHCKICGLFCEDKSTLDIHVENEHSQEEVMKNTINKMSISLKKMAVEKKKLKQENNILKKEVDSARNEIAIKTKRISVLMVENSTKDEIVKVHTENAKEKNIFPCVRCDYKAKNKQELAGHFKFEHLQCVKCKENFLKSEELKSHMELSHSDSVWNRKKNCELCKRSFSNWCLYETHIKKHQCLKFTCTVCTKVFYTKAEAVEHMETMHGKDEGTKVYTCHKCNFKAPTEREVDQHLDSVHLAGFETITNMENSIKGNEPNKFSCCLDCGFNASTEEEISKHLDTVHKIRDENNPPTKSTSTQSKTTKTVQIVKTCKNGDSCRFLKVNRCLFFHEIAAQPEEQWQEVRPRKQRQERQGGETWAEGRYGGFYRVHQVTVKWCKNSDKCDKGYLMANGKMWSCPFRHQALDFIQEPSNRRK